MNNALEIETTLEEKNYTYNSSNFNTKEQIRKVPFQTRDYPKN